MRQPADLPTAEWLARLLQHPPDRRTEILAQARACVEADATLRPRARALVAAARELSVLGQEAAEMLDVDEGECELEAADASAGGGA